MNHNFVNWEITQLLPDENENSICCWVEKYNRKSIVSSGEYRESEYLRDAWSFEDVRLYLESKGYFFSRLFDSNNNHYTKIEIYFYNGTDKGYVIETCYSYSYEQARNESIEFCLKRINDEATE